MSDTAFLEEFSTIMGWTEGAAPSVRMAVPPVASAPERGGRRSRGLPALAAELRAEPGRGDAPDWPDAWFSDAEHGGGAQLCRRLWAAVFLASLHDDVNEALCGGQDPPRMPGWVGSSNCPAVASLAGFDGVAVAERSRRAFRSRRDLEALFGRLRPNARE